jgi:hypothetical protein
MLESESEEVKNNETSELRWYFKGDERVLCMRLDVFSYEDNSFITDINVEPTRNEILLNKYNLYGDIQNGSVSIFKQNEEIMNLEIEKLCEMGKNLTNSEAMTENEKKFTPHSDLPSDSIRRMKAKGECIHELGGLNFECGITSSEFFSIHDDVFTKFNFLHAC